jgi:hypothetical protein
MNINFEFEILSLSSFVFHSIIIVSTLKGANILLTDDGNVKLGRTYPRKQESMRFE